MVTVDRFLVLFSRDPGREARAKGFGVSAEDLFTAFARGWEEAARRSRARLVIATPPEDLAAWRGRGAPPRRASAQPRRTLVPRGPRGVAVQAARSRSPLDDSARIFVRQAPGGGRSSRGDVSRPSRSRRRRRRTERVCATGGL